MTHQHDGHHGDLCQAVNPSHSGVFCQIPRKRPFLHQNTLRRCSWGSNVRKPAAKQEAMATGFCNRWTYGTGLYTGLQGRGAGYPHAGDGLTRRRGRTAAHRAHLWRTLGSPRAAPAAQSAPSGGRGGRVGRVVNVDCSPDMVIRWEVNHAACGRSVCNHALHIDNITSISSPPAATSPPTPWRRSPASCARAPRAPSSPARLGRRRIRGAARA